MSTGNNFINPNTPLAPMPREGDIFGGCRLTEVIGQGGMSKVFLGFEVELEVKRALKIMHHGLLGDIRRKFDAESKICAQLDHPNIVRVHGSGISLSGLPFIKMEYVDGKNLRVLLDGQTHLHPAAALSIIIIVCKALEYARKARYTIWGQTHEGLIHRDLKPENIMITNSGVVKVMDFGIAMSSREAMASALGTIQYMSPEQHEDGEITSSSDIFSLGVILYELITGEKPFKQPTLYEIINKKNNGEYAQIKDFVSGIPDSIESIIKRCLLPNPEKRYAVYESLQFACEQVITDMIDSSPEEIVSLYIKDATHFRMNFYKQAHPDKSKKLKIPEIAIYIVLGFLIVLASLGYLMLSQTQKAKVDLQAPTQELIPISIIDLSTPVVKKPIETAPLIDSPVTVKQKAVERTIPPVIQEKTAVNQSALANAYRAYKTKEYKDIPAILVPILDAITQKSTKDSAVVILLESYYMTDAFNEVIRMSRKYESMDARYTMILAATYDALDDSKKAITFFDRAIFQPSLFGEATRSDAYLLRGRFYQKLFEKVGDQQTKQQAAAAWLDAKNAVCKKSNAACLEITSSLAKLTQ